MFSLEELDLSNFHTDNVRFMNSMFSGCSSLKELNISHFNCKLALVNYMFSFCLDELKIKIRALNLGIDEKAFNNY